MAPTEGVKNVQGARKAGKEDQPSQALRLFSVIHSALSEDDFLSTLPYRKRLYLHPRARGMDVVIGSAMNVTLR